MPCRGPEGSRLATLKCLRGAGRRRDWSDDQKAAIVAESYVGDASVSEVARRHGLTPSQLFTWRRSARRQAVSVGKADTAFVVPAIVEETGSDVASGTDEPPLIGFDLEGASVWVGLGADVGMVTSIIRALKDSR